MREMKKLVKIATSLTLMGGIFVGANGVSANTDVIQKSSPNIMIEFDDVPTGHWAYDEITNLVYHRIMYGYGNGKFGTEDNITREQAAAVLHRALHLKRSVFNENPYGDISGKSTMFPYEILHLTSIGIFKGDENGNFRPKDTLTRAELAQILTKAYELKTKSPHTFTDIPKNHWARDAISALQSNNVAVGTGDGKFEPEMLVTRGQFAKFLQRSIDNSPGKME
ncbi:MULTISPECIES: S-layer homology domain-containing protein [Bacillus cereus group]|uniref:S-layer homology domain-containing protein n=1 Tax=Bacillus cereus group TaxID=86661 RepID=UPI0008FDAAA3|nr:MULTISPECIES: S-layer homology domain-containing protein [Bacillus cereus group]MDG1621914.1 S-layer homology domain-containing protein [Bacillus mobilis]MDX5840290.1 S-layer homology domain-containing protein [Bacillus cereus group sp. BfR-BA-01700]OJE43448.1 S-layer protein [Bacillus mobilis]HDR7239463.1 S-layer homology domain-containing protein [Bacillus mobilis]